MHVLDPRRAAATPVAAHAWLETMGNVGKTCEVCVCGCVKGKCREERSPDDFRLIHLLSGLLDQSLPYGRTCFSNAPARGRA
jgi:hypothetical protein